MKNKISGALLALSMAVAISCMNPASDSFPDVSGSFGYNTDVNTVNGKGYFVAEGEGEVTASGFGEIMITLYDGTIWFDENCELLNRQGNFCHLVSYGGEFRADGEGYAMLQGEGMITYYGKGFKFYYQD